MKNEYLVANGFLCYSLRYRNQIIPNINSLQMDVEVTRIAIATTRCRPSHPPSPRASLSISQIIRETSARGSPMQISAMLSKIFPPLSSSRRPSAFCKRYAFPLCAYAARAVINIITVAVPVNEQRYAVIRLPSNNNARSVVTPRPVLYGPFFERPRGYRGTQRASFFYARGD
ncbi:hypothetical protein PUN28_000213 [Cardiocondyla obscurior]|uniref:Uncharacterized protein n=1 Tax=Cardiocondyla obscurior TaxID=286306 RepID=A0AAW2GYR6_9HYME